MAHLFNLYNRLEGDLRKGEITDSIIKDFAKKGYPLSENARFATVEEEAQFPASEGERWVINDQHVLYGIYKIDKSLKVHGIKIPNLRLVKRLGKGGFGAAYLAEHTKLKKERVVKILNTNLITRKEALERFLREARILDILRNYKVENTVYLYDYGEIPEERIYYMIMDYCEGFSLKHFLKKNTILPWQKVLQISCQILQLLENVHQLGIIHRDLKPDNIMIELTEQGSKIKVLDFGIAKLKTIDNPDEQDQHLWKDEDMSLTANLIGTPKYMSPEQANQEKLDGRSDLYSLGVIMYEMLVGRAPFLSKKSYMDILYKHIHESPQRLGQVKGEMPIPPGVEQLVFKALEKDPHQRYQSALQFREACELLAKSQNCDLSDATIGEGLTMPDKTIYEVVMDEDISDVFSTPTSVPSSPKSYVGLVVAVILLALLTTVVFVLMQNSAKKSSRPFAKMKLNDHPAYWKESVLHLSGQLKGDPKDKRSYQLAVGKEPPRKISGDFKLSAPLNREGRNQIHLTLLHKKHKVQELDIEVIRDTVLPKFGMDGSKLITREKEIVLKGEVEEKNLKSLRVDGKPLAWNVLSKAEGIFSFEVKIKTQKNPKIQIEAIDKADNKTIYTYSVTYDSSIPQLTFSQNRIIYTQKDNITISGTIDEPHFERIYRKDGGEINMNGKQFWFDLPLKVGKLVVEIVAEDQAGNTTTKKITLIKDNERPRIKVKSPPENPYSTYERQMFIEGHASDPAGLASLILDGSSLLSSKSGEKYPFKKKVVLHLGENTFTLKARDSAGNEQIKKISITRFLDISPKIKKLEEQMKSREYQKVSKKLPEIFKLAPLSADHLSALKVIQKKFKNRDLQFRASLIHANFTVISQSTPSLARKITGIKSKYISYKLNIQSRDYLPLYIYIFQIEIQNNNSKIWFLKRTSKGNPLKPKRDRENSYGVDVRDKYYHYLAIASLQKLPFSLLKKMENISPGLMSRDSTVVLLALQKKIEEELGKLGFKFTFRWINFRIIP